MYTSTISSSKGRQPIQVHLVTLALVFLLALVLRLIPITYLEWQHPGWHAQNINEIEFYYDDVARSLIAGKGFVHSVNPRSADQPYRFTPGTPFHFVPPLYAWWLYLVYSIFGPNVFIAKILQGVMDSAVCLLLYLLGRRIFKDYGTALLSSALYAVYPLAIVMSGTLYYQIPMNIALCWVLLCFSAPVTAGNGLWTGVALAASALAKPVTLPLFMLMPAIRLGESLVRNTPVKSAVTWSMAFMVAGIITLAPWTIRNYLVFHKFVPVQHGGAEAFLQGSREEYIDLDVATLREKYGESGLAPAGAHVTTAVNNHLSHFIENPLDYFRFLGKKFLLSWYNTEGKKSNRYALLAQTPFLLFALLSLTLSLRSWLKTPNWYVPAMVLYICGIQVIIFPLVRYTLSAMPLVMLIAASGINILLAKTLQDDSPIRPFSRGGMDRRPF